MDRFPNEFCGGQRQRVAIAKAVVLKPKFILLDKSTPALDLSIQAQIIDLLRELRRKHGLHCPARRGRTGHASLTRGAGGPSPDRLNRGGHEW